MEQRIIQKACPGHPVRLIGCNGDDVAIERMTDFIETQIRQFGDRHYPIIVIFDREKREASKEQIAEQVCQSLDSRGLSDQDVRVFVADREAEDWYLLDLAGICRHYGLEAPTDACSGKGGLARLLSPKVDYHETTVGVEIFDIVSKSVLAEGCGMFGSLMQTAVELNCGFVEGFDL